jgi:hypothetical protein
MCRVFRARCCNGPALTCQSTRACSARQNHHRRSAACLLNLKQVQHQQTFVQERAVKTNEKMLQKRGRVKYVWERLVALRLHDGGVAGRRAQRVHIKGLGFGGFGYYFVVSIVFARQKYFKAVP